jgi:thiol-disulfide isomerase/thioredoxin
VKHFGVVSFLLGLSLLLASWIQAEPTPSPPAAAGQSITGRAAPDFSLKTVQGDRCASSDLRGKVVLINFWATWCPPCRAELPDLIQLQEKYRQQGLVIVGVSFDEKDAVVQKFYGDKKINYPVARVTPEFGQSYGALLGLSNSQLVRPDGIINATLPSTILISRSGQIGFAHVGSLDISELDKEVRKQL